MSDLTLSAAQRSMANRSIDVERTQGDARTVAKSADLNGDGKVSGQQETKAMFRAVDGFDSNGSRNSIQLSKGGPQTPSGRIWNDLQRAAAPAGSATPSRGINGPASTNAATSGATSTTGTAGKGLATDFRKVRDISVDQMKKALPAHAQHLADDFIRAGKQHGVDPMVLAAVSRHETGGWKSSAFRNKNNAMGISSKTGPRSFDNVSKSIDVAAQNLASPTGYYKNAQNLRDV